MDRFAEKFKYEWLDKKRPQNLCIISKILNVVEEPGKKRLLYSTTQQDTKVDQKMKEEYLYCE